MSNTMKYDAAKIKRLKEICPPGTAIKLRRMHGEAQMPEGLTGTVYEIDDAAQIHVKWSNGSSLALITDADSFTILPGSGNEYEQAVKIHYHDKNGKMTFIERKAIAVTSGIKDMDNITCLVNTCGDDTGFEVIPEDINKWIDRIGIDYHCFPNLERTWGKENSRYVFTFNYEIPHELSDESGDDRKVTMPYKDQLEEIVAAAKNIAIAFPCTDIRVLEQAACHNAHELEIAFPYPCDVAEIKSAYERLVSSFDYIWDIGRE